MTVQAARRRIRNPSRLIEVSTAIMLFLACACATSGVPSGSADQSVRISHSDGWLAMGTFFEIEVRMYESQSREVLDWIDEARREIARLERIYSRHDHASELSVLNRHRAEGAEDICTHMPSVELAALLAEAKQLNRDTKGAFDIAIHPPNLDLDAISKGAVLDHLREGFVGRFAGAAALLSFGQSSIVAIGDPNGQGWRLALQSRDPGRGFLGEVRLRDQSLSMSSSLTRVEGSDRVDGSHIIDPRTKRPVIGAIEAVVISDSAIDADAWSTALLVIGRIPPRIDGRSRDETFEAILIDDEGRISRTPGWPGSNAPAEF